VQGQYNLPSSILSAFIIGNGINDSDRSNLVFAAGNQVEITGSLSVSGILSVTDSITGSLFGTSSWAVSSSQAISSSVALTASFLPVGTYNITSSWAQSASNAVNSQTASFLPAGTYDITSSYAVTASYALTSAGGGGGATVIKKENIILASGSWVSASLYGYLYIDSDIVASSSIVDFTPNTASISTVIGAVVYPTVVVTAGSASFYAQNQPTNDITGELIITNI
jgi:hypothetical protein